MLRRILVVVGSAGFLALGGQVADADSGGRRTGADFTGDRWGRVLPSLGRIPYDPTPCLGRCITDPPRYPYFPDGRDALIPGYSLGYGPDR